MLGERRFWLRMVYLGYISVSRRGVIITVTGKITAGTPIKNGYLYWTAWDRWSRKQRSIGVHRLVWMIFKGPIPKGMEVNHKDNDRQNNRLVNLELVTSQGNSDHAVKQGRVPSGERSRRACFTNDEVRALRAEWERVKGTISQQAFAFSKETLTVSRHAVISVLNRYRYKNVV